MGICMHCRTKVTTNDRRFVNEHKSCWAEWCNRMDRKICVFCNEWLSTLDIGDNNIHHSHCHGPGVGYPYQ